MAKQNGILDETDVAIVETLKADPRISNRALAQAVGVSEPTLYSRMRDLHAHNVCELRTQVDYVSLGYKRLAEVAVQTSSRPISDIADQIAKTPEVLGAMSFGDDPRLIVGLVAADDDHLNTLIHDKIGAIRGISRLSVTLISRVIKSDVAFGEIGVDRHDPLPLLPGSVPLDEVDLSVMEALRADARLSNREVARAVGISEANVRRRVQRLLDGGVIKFKLVCTPAKFGLDIWGFAHIATNPVAKKRIAQHLANSRWAHTVIETTGRFGLTFAGLFPSQAEFDRLLEETIAIARNDIDLSVRRMLRSYKHNCDYVRFIPD